MEQIKKIENEILNEIRGKVNYADLEEILVSVVYKYLLDEKRIKDNKLENIYEPHTELKEIIISKISTLNLNEIRELLLSFILNFKRTFMNRELFSSNDLGNLAYELLDLKNGDSFCDVGCGDGYLMSLIQDKCLKNGVKLSKLSGIEINLSQINIAKMLTAIFSSNIEIESKNIIDSINIDFNKGFCFPPFGLRLKNITANDQFSKFNYKFSLRNCSEWIFIDRMLDCLDKNDNFKGVAILSPRCFYNEEDKKYREILLEKGKIEAIIELPEGVLKGTGLRSCIVVFSNNNKKVKMVDGSKVMGDNPTRFLNAPLPVDEVLKLYNNAKLVDCRDLIKSNNINPSTYLMCSDIEFKGIPLGNIAEIIAGSQYTLSHFEKDIVNELTGYKILTSSDINDNHVNWNELKNIKLEDHKLERTVLQKNDIILTSKSNKVKIIIVDQALKDKVIVTGSMLIVRVKNKEFNPTYVALYLSSPIGKQALKKIQRGSYIITITAKDLSTVLIPFAPIKNQLNLECEYKEKLSSYFALKEELKNIENYINNIFIDRMGDK